MIRSFVFIPLVCAFWGRAFCLFGRPGGGGGGGAGLLCLGFDAFAAGGGADGEGREGGYVCEAHLVCPDDLRDICDVLVLSRVACTDAGELDSGAIGPRAW